MIGRHHPAQGRRERSLGIGQEGRDARERLFFLRVEDVKDSADQERVGGFFPMVPPFERTFGIDQNIGDILDIAHLMRAAAYLQQRVVSSGSNVGRIRSEEHTSELQSLMRISYAVFCLKKKSTLELLTLH